jgi:hypothetical protein
MLKIKEHWLINIVDYIPEIIRSLYEKIERIHNTENFQGLRFQSPSD